MSPINFRLLYQCTDQHLQDAWKYNSTQLFHTFLGDSQNYQPRGADSLNCDPERYDIDVLLPTFILKELLLGNTRDQKIFQIMSPGDSSLRTGSIWLDLVTGEQS